MEEKHSDELQDTKPTRKKRNPLRVLIMLYLVPLGIGLSVYFVYARINGYEVRLEAVQAKYDQKIAELRANGDTVFFPELDQARPPVPDAENGALLIGAMIENCLVFTDTDGDQNIWIFGTPIDLNEPLDPIENMKSRQFVADNRKVLFILDPLMQFEASRMSWVFSDDPSDLFPRVSCTITIENIRKLMLLDACLALIDGNPSTCADRTSQIFRMGTYLVREPVYEGYIGGSRVKYTATYALEMMLSHTEYSPEELVSIQNELVSVLNETSLYSMCLADRAMVMTQLEQLIKRWRRCRDCFTGKGEYTDEVQLRMVQLAVLENFDKLLETAKTEDWNAYTNQIDQYDSDQKQALAYMDLPERVEYCAYDEPSLRVYSFVHASHVYAKCALMGIAAERFRLDHGRWPESLDELVPKYVESVAVDSFIDQPLHYLRTDNGIAVYSVGLDGEDDGGQWPPEKKSLLNEEYDIVFQLPDPENRTPVRIRSEAVEDPQQAQGE